MQLTSTTATSPERLERVARFSAQSRRRGFTLVELLVVLGIIAVLVALLVPAAMAALNTARRASIAFKVSQLADGIEKYRAAHDDYPPSSRDVGAIQRHLRKCYPKIPPAYFIASVSVLQNLDEGEALVFWLSQVNKSATNPFPSLATPGIAIPSPEAHYVFKETDLQDDDGDGYPSFVCREAKDTYFLYLDARSYDEFMDYSNASSPAFAESRAVGEARPYFSDTIANSAATDARQRYKLMNPTSFQIICAGQDGEFNLGFNDDDSDVKLFPSGLNYSNSDRDNITNFSDGRRLMDNIP